MEGRRADALDPIELQAAPPEVGALAGAVNQLLGQVQHSLATQRRFISDAGSPSDMAAAPSCCRPRRAAAGRAAWLPRAADPARRSGVAVRPAAERRHRHQGRHSFWTAFNMTSGLNGLTTQALAPAAWPSAFLASADSVVSMMTGVKR